MSPEVCVFIPAGYVIAELQISAERGVPANPFHIARELICVVLLAREDPQVAVIECGWLMILCWHALDVFEKCPRASNLLHT